ncbi:MAG: hypothetical protein R2758_03135 [Bacteroidales bacterium]
MTRYSVFSPDGSMIAYSSMEEDGYESDLERLFVYNIATGERKWAPEGWDYNVGNMQWNGTGEIWFDELPTSAHSQYSIFHLHQGVSPG